MQKRSHKLLASALLRDQAGFGSRRHDLAFLFGSFQPDCNPLSYLKGSLHAHKFQGHHFLNSHRYINTRIRRLQHCNRWTIWQYYTLGKLTHYLADAFTYPHNENFRLGIRMHRRYETQLRQYLAVYLSNHAMHREDFRQDVISAIDDLHRQYLSSAAGIRNDARYILRAMELLMAGCLPSAHAGNAA